MRALTCREFVEFLDDYLAKALPEAERAVFDAHLAQCPSCVAFMKTYRDSIALGRAVLAGDASAVPEALVRAILAAKGDAGTL